jgi:F5/8 type C domain/Pectate lyase superfamily protein
MQIAQIAPTKLICLIVIAMLSLAGVSFGDQKEIDPLLWNATASNSPERAMLAFDRDPHTRWDTGASQQVGQWFQVDLGETRSVSDVTMDTTASNNDYPRQYELSTSTDGKEWTVVAKGVGATLTDIIFDTPSVCRYIRITIPKNADLSGGFWSIHELRAYGPSDSTLLTTPRPEIHWHTVKTIFPTRDIVVAGLDITDFGIQPDKGADASQAMNVAIRLLARAGGGTLWMPAGHYRLSQPLSLDNNVTIRGDWTPPEPGKPIQGTVLEMTANRGNAEGPPGIGLDSGSAVIGIAFWYPEQQATNITPYPVTLKQFGGTGMGVENITFINAYRGFACGPEGCALFFARNIYGTVLETGIKIDGTSDIGRMEKIRFSPDYWAGSGLPNSPTATGPHVGWMAENGSGIIMRRNDWSYAYDVELKGYRYGFQSLPSLEDDDVKRGIKNYPNGQNTKFRFIDCRTAIHCENVNDDGMMFHDLDITGAEEGILADETFKGTLQIQNSRVSASKAAIRLLGPGQILLTNCSLAGNPSSPAANIDNATGFVELMGCTPPISAQSGSAPGVGEIRVEPAADPSMDKLVDPYSTPTDRFAPPTNRLAVVTDSIYGAKGDAATDDTDAVKNAISDMAKSGGTVFFPSGEYRLTSELVVPTGVELRGVGESPHHAETFGSVLDVVAGKGDENGKPFITLSAHSGLRGLTFHYPEQDTTNVTPYPWMIRGAGDGVWLINLSSTLPYRMVDLATVKCDNHFLDYVAGNALQEAFRIGGGSTGGRVLNCQLNENYYAFTDKYANSPSRLKNGNAAGDATFNYSKAHELAYVIGDCTNEILFQNFVYGANKGIVLTGTDTGPSGWCMGQGGDTCQYDIWAERIGKAGMPLINNQLVTVDSSGPDRSYIGLAAQFTGTLELLGVDAWGGPTAAIRIDGGRLALISAVIVQSGNATLSVKAPGSVTFSNAVLRNPDLVLEQDKSNNDVKLTGIFIARRDPIVIDSITDLPDELQELLVSGGEIGVPFPASSALPTTGWRLKTKINPNDAALALDGNPSTRWTTGRTARSGDEVVVEMDDAHLISKVRVDSVASGSDYPRRFKLYLSTDGINWGDPVASGRGEADLRIGFKPQMAKFIRLVNLSNMGGFWSIHEFQAAEK